MIMKSYYLYLIQIIHIHIPDDLLSETEDLFIFNIA